MAGLTLAGAALAGAGAGVLNTGIQGAINYGLQKDAQKFNASQAQMQRDWSSQEAVKSRDWETAENQLNRDFQERMSSTAYQRQLADMEAAGINPNLALGGMGASAAGGSPMGNSGVPQGSTATSSAIGVGQNNIFGEIASSAIKQLIHDHPNGFIKEIHQEITSTAQEAHDNVENNEQLKALLKKHYDYQQQVWDERG